MSIVFFFLNFTEAKLLNDSVRVSTSQILKDLYYIYIYLVFTAWKLQMNENHKHMQLIIRRDNEQYWNK